ncbi:MAG: cupin domain-containing protein [Proteobacteria bacterium]|nr:cupin domain-containing protein [Pseudomonadota bacterium]
MSQLSVDQLVKTSGNGQKTASDMTLIFRSAALGGDFSVMEGEVRSKELLAPHTHTHEDQLVFLLEGELEFEVGGADGLRFSAKKGDYVLKPRGISHGFWNVGDVTVRYIELSGKDGFEKFIDGRQEGVASFLDNAKKQLDMEIHIERIPGLMLKHGLTGLAGVNLQGQALQGLAGLASIVPRFR